MTTKDVTARMATAATVIDAKSAKGARREIPDFGRRESFGVGSMLKARLSHSRQRPVHRPMTPATFSRARGSAAPAKAGCRGVSAAPTVKPLPGLTVLRLTL